MIQVLTDFVVIKFIFNRLLLNIKQMPLQEQIDDVLDLVSLRRDQSTWQRVLGDVTKQSAAQQVVIGGATGWYEKLLCYFCFYRNTFFNSVIILKKRFLL